MQWIYLAGAIIFEVMGTLSIKQATLGNTYVWSAVITLCYVTSFTLIYYATKTIDIGIAYAIWAGAGTSLIVLLGWIIFHEEMSLMKVIGVITIIFGVVLLKLDSH